MLEPQIIQIAEKKIIGIHLTMSLNNNETATLWREFMPKRRLIGNPIGSELISLQNYNANYFENFNPMAEFEKWAAVEVSDFENVPSGMHPFLIPEGQYAVFNYQGSSQDNSIFQYIFGTWLPESNFQLDNRPHFEILGENYRNNDPQSQEDIYIPIKEK